MKFRLLVALAATGWMILIADDRSALVTSASAAAANGCALAKPPAGASETTVKSWVDPRPCDWAQKYPLFSPPSTGDGSLERVQKAGQLTICAETDQPPGVYKDPATSKLIGYEPDILQNLVERLGIKKYSYVEVQFPNYIPAIQAKKCDAVVGVIGITSQRAKAPGMKYTWPYLVEGDRVI
jgi:ABC-type amino acid transport substrate-binding protein